MIKRFTITALIIIVFSYLIYPYGGNIPTGLPTTFGFGAIDKEDNQGGDAPTQWKDNQGTTCWDYNYQYLTSGWETWKSPAGQWAVSELTHWQSQGQETSFTYYYNGGSTSMLTSTSTMATWYNNLITLYKGIAANVSSGKVTIVHIEPDLLGFCETGSFNPSSTNVSVASSGVSDVSGYANTLQGWWQAIMALRDKYASGKALVAIHYSHWASDDAFNSTTISLSGLNTSVDTVSNFLISVMNGHKADLVYAESSDRDGDWYAHVKSDTKRWANMDFTTPPNLPGQKTWGRIGYILDRLSTNLGLRVIMWQIPVGNTFFKTCDNSDGHYRDNASQAILPATSATGASGTPGDAYTASDTSKGVGYWAAHGVIGVLFGEGTYNWVDSGANTTHLRDYGPTDNTTNPTSSSFNTTGNVTGDAWGSATSAYADNDGGYVRLAVAKYCSTGKYPIGTQPTATKTSTTGPTPTITPTSSQTPYICSKIIYDGDNTGTNLAAGVVTNNSPATMTETTGGCPGNAMTLNYVLPAATPYWQPLLWTLNTPVAIADNTTLRFEVKSASGTAPNFIIVIDWGSTAYQIDVNSYVSTTITTTWQTAQIPLSVLKAAGTSTITFIDFINGNNTSYTVYVDNIRLTGGACATSTFTPAPATSTFTRTPTYTPTRTTTPSPTYSNSPTVPNTATFTYTFTRTATPTYTSTQPAATSTFTYTFTSTRTVTPTYTSTLPPATSTFTGTSTFTSTATPSVTPSFTRTPTGTYTYTFTSTNTRTATPTVTVSPTITDTWTPHNGTETNTPTITQTWTNSVSPTRTATPTDTGTFTRTVTLSFTATSTNTPTNAPPTATFTNIIQSATYTPTCTNTVVPPTQTSTQIIPTNTATPTWTITCTATIPTSPSMVLSYNVPLTVIVGQQLTVILTVSNNGTANLTNVAPADMATPGTAMLSLASPTPASDPALAMGSTVEFTWIYNVLTAGTVTFQTSVNSDQVNTTTITSPTVNCVNPTPTNTPIIPPTATYTSTSTAPTATQTIINTSPTPAPVSVQITGLLAYPNPLNPAIYSNLIFTFNVNQPANAIDEIGLRIYSSSYRLIREAVYSGADKDNILNSRRLIYASDNLIGLANGSYYYYIYAVQNGKETRSKINKLIIIK